MTTKYGQSSLYKNTKITDNKYLDMLESVITNPSDYDLIDVTLASKYNNRPDLLAHKMYNNAELWWIFAEFNQDILKDPIMDFKTGVTIKAPATF